MLRISPISCNGNRYQVKRDSKIQPVTKVSNRNNSSNSSSFEEILEEEIEKQKKKKLKKEE